MRMCKSCCQVLTHCKKLQTFVDLFYMFGHCISSSIFTNNIMIFVIPASLMGS